MRQITYIEFLQALEVVVKYRIQNRLMIFDYNQFFKEHLN